ncbi:hypothetical protein TNCV_2938631 [Trichonephila clavipes]|nr:hypothetical protein TNCV_2938631 [Trichonephila clavipes]
MKNILDKVSLLQKRISELSINRRKSKSEFRNSNQTRNKSRSRSQEAKENFEKCKQDLPHATLLSFPDPNLQLALFTDASNSEIESVLQQFEAGSKGINISVDRLKPTYLYSTDGDNPDHFRQLEHAPTLRNKILIAQRKIEKQPPDLLKKDSREQLHALVDT